MLPAPTSFWNAQPSCWFKAQLSWRRSKALGSAFQHEGHSFQNNWPFLWAGLSNLMRTDHCLSSNGPSSSFHCVPQAPLGDKHPTVMIMLVSPWQLACVLCWMVCLVSGSNGFSLCAIILESWLYTEFNFLVCFPSQKKVHVVPLFPNWPMSKVRFRNTSSTLLLLPLPKT